MSRQEFLIRLATADDIEQIAELYIKSWQQTYKGLLRQEYLDSLTLEGVSKRWGDYILEERHGIFVATTPEATPAAEDAVTPEATPAAEDAVTPEATLTAEAGSQSMSKILGFGAFKPYHRIDDCIYIESLHVDEVFRGMGIGSAIIKQIYEVGKSEHYGQMAVCLVKGNDNARNLYTKLGASHYRDKVDDFTGEISYSEILTWDL